MEIDRTCIIIIDFTIRTLKFFINMVLWKQHLTNLRDVLYMKLLFSKAKYHFSVLLATYQNDRDWANIYFLSERRDFIIH